MRGGSLFASSRWLATIAAMALWVVCLSSTASAAEATSVSISAPSEPVAAGQQFSVSIDVVPDTAIAGMQFDLHFDPSVVVVQDVAEGDLLGQGGASTFFDPGNINNEAGIVTGAFGAITTPGATVSLQGTFATITLTAKQQSDSIPLSLSNVIVGDKEGRAVPVTFDDTGAAGATDDTDAAGATEQRPAFRLWVMGVIVGVALVLVAATVTVILLRRRQMLRALEAQGLRK